MAQITEVKGDLFQALPDLVIAHCVSGDFAMGAGVAGQITKKYPDIRGYLRRMAVSEYGVVGGDKETFGRTVGKAIRYQSGKDVIYNLVTKPHVWMNSEEHEYPNMMKMKQCLADLKWKMATMGDSHKGLALPRIGCGLDRMQWDEVKAAIDDTFGGHPTIFVVIYTL